MLLPEKVVQMERDVPETKQWLDTYRMNQKATVSTYANNLCSVFEAAGIKTFDQVKDFCASDLQKIYDIAEKDGWSKTTLNDRIANLKRFLSWCSAEGLCEVNALNRVKRFKCEKEPTYVFTVEDQEKIMNTVTSKRLRCILGIYLETGYRKMSVINLRLSDFEGSKITVTDKGDKTTTCSLSDELAGMINDYIKTDRAEAMKRYVGAGGTDAGWLFVSCFQGGRKNTDWENGLKLHANTLNDQIKNVARKAGVKNWDKITPHSFRKRFGITEYYSNGMDIIATQRKMHHSNVSQTAYYVGKYDITEEEKEILTKRNQKESLAIDTLKEQIEMLAKTIEQQQKIIGALLEKEVK